MLIDLKTSEDLDDYVNEIASHLQPAVSLTNFALNIFCSVIFARKRLFKETVFKYLMFNSLIDAFYLFMVSVKPLLNTLVQTYVYFFLVSVLITQSKLFKVFLTFDKLSRMTDRSRLKYSTRCLIGMLLALGFVLNIPFVISYELFEYLWFKFTYFELMLLNANNWWASWLAFGLIFEDMMLFYLLVKSSFKLKKAMLNNMEKLNELNKTCKEHIVIKIDEEEKNFKEKKIQNIKDYEMNRQQVCNLILINNLVYALGWIVNLVIHCLQFLLNFAYGSLDVSVGYNYYANLDVCNALANLVLAWSLGINFFVYFFGNQTLRLVALGRRKQLMTSCCFLKPDILKL